MRIFLGPNRMLTVANSCWDQMVQATNRGELRWITITDVNGLEHIINVNAITSVDRQPPLS